MVTALIKRSILPLIMVGVLHLPLKWRNKIQELTKVQVVHNTDTVVLNNTNLVGETFVLTGTVYHPTKGQCDRTPFVTADGSKINKKSPIESRICGVSYRLLLNGSFKKGDTIFVSCNDKTFPYFGIWKLNDTNNDSFGNNIDFCVGQNNTFGKWKGIRVTKWSNKIQTNVQ